MAAFEQMTTVQVDLKQIVHEAIMTTLRSMTESSLSDWRLQTLKEQLLDQVIKPSGKFYRDDAAEHLLQDVLSAIDRAGLALVPRPS